MDWIIPPRLTLPSHTGPGWVDAWSPSADDPYATVPLPLVRPRKKRRLSCSILAYQLFYGSIALKLAQLAYVYLAAQPVYRIVSWVILLILWSHCATATLRQKSGRAQTVELIATMSLQAVQLGERLRKRRGIAEQSKMLKDDTSVFLSSLREKLQ